MSIDTTFREASDFPHTRLVHEASHSAKMPTQFQQVQRALKTLRANNRALLRER